MNILFIHEVEWVNKIVYDLHFLAESLSLKGHNVYAIYYPNKWTKDTEFKEESISRAFPEASVHIICPKFIKLPILSRISAFITHYFAIKKAIKDKSIDAIMLYSAPTNGLQTVYLAKKAGIPVIFRSIDALSELVPNKILRFPTKLIEKIVYSNVDMILTITHHLSEYVIRMGAKRDKVKLLQLMVDADMFKPLQEASGLKFIVYTGGLYDFCGLDMLIKCFHKVIKQAPDARLIIVGDGKQRINLEILVAKLQLDKYVKMTGGLPYLTMPRYINDADICINPFLLTDATKDIFPSKIIQYLACGKPVIATPLPGLKAMIEGEDQGVLYADAGDDMVNKIVQLLKSKEDRERLGNAGLKYIQENNTQGAIIKQLEIRLQEVIDDKR